MQKKFGVDQSIVICLVNLEKTIGSWWGLPLISKRENGKILGAWDIVFQEWGILLENISKYIAHR